VDSRTAEKEKSCRDQAPAQSLVHMHSSLWMSERQLTEKSSRQMRQFSQQNAHAKVGVVVGTVKAVSDAAPAPPKARRPGRMPASAWPA
jgi:hypothetical protein